ncbi:MAG: aminotransferase class V-fold PLP-dependent enzyme, partial [Candidatus Paceibacterota bacterium]
MTKKVLGKNQRQYVYLDYAATTPMDTNVFETMLPYLQDRNLQGNPSSLHSVGRLAKAGLDESRNIVARTLGVREDEVIFTGSGTESDNLALVGVARAYGHKGKHIIVSAIEHKAILETANALKKEGFSISFVPVSKNGVVNTEKLLSLVRPDT